MADDKDQEEAKRRDEVLKRMLNTKPQPHKQKRDPAEAKPRSLSVEEVQDSVKRPKARR